METSLKLVANNAAYTSAFGQNTQFAHNLAALHFANGHIKNPFQRNSQAYNAYEKAAMALIKGL